MAELSPHIPMASRSEYEQMSARVAASIRDKFGPLGGYYIFLQGAETKADLQAQLEAAIRQNSLSMSDVLRLVAPDAVSTAEAVSTVAGGPINGVAQATDFLWNIRDRIKPLSEEDYQAIGTVYANAVYEARANQPWYQKLLDNVIAFWQSITGDVTMEQALQARQLRREAVAARSAIEQPPYNSDVAQLAAQVNELGFFTGVPAHSQTGALPAMQEEIDSHRGADFFESAGQLLNTIWPDSNIGKGVAIVAGGIATYKTAKFTFGFTAGAGEVVRDMRQVAATVTKSTGLVGLARTIAPGVRTEAELAEAAARGSRFSFRLGRFAGRSAVLLGAVPIAGGVVGGISNYFSWDEAQADPLLSEADKALLEKLLALDTAAGFAGFAGEGATTAMNELARNTSPQLAQYIPPTAISLATELFGSDAEGNRPIDRISAAVENIKYLGTSTIDQTPTIEQRQSVLFSDDDVQTAAQRWLEYQNTHLSGQDGAEILADNPYSANPIINSLRQLYEQDNYGRSFTQYMDLVAQVGSPEFSFIDPPQTNPYMTQGQLLTDLANRGPVYMRLMEQSLAKGYTLAEFDRDVIRSMDGLSSVYRDYTGYSPIQDLQDAQRASRDIAVLDPTKFGGLDSNFITLPSEAETARYNSLFGQDGQQEGQHSFYTGILAMLEEQVAFSDQTLAAIDSRIEFQLEAGEPITLAQLKSTMDNSAAMQRWMSQNPQGRDQLRAFYSDLARNSSPDTLIQPADLPPALLDYAAFVQQNPEGKAQFQAEINALLSPENQRIFDQLQALVGDSGEQFNKTLAALQLALTLPQNAQQVTNPQLKALIEQSEALREAYEQSKSAPAGSPERTKLYEILEQFTLAAGSYHQYEAQRMQMAAVQTERPPAPAPTPPEQLSRADGIAPTPFELAAAQYREGDARTAFNGARISLDPASLPNGTTVAATPPLAQTATADQPSRLGLSALFS